MSNVVQFSLGRPGSSLNFGNCLRFYRMRLGLTQEELAKKVGMTQPKISRIEKNLTSPTANTISQIIIALGGSTPTVVFTAEVPDDAVMIFEDETEIGKEKAGCSPPK